MEMTLAKTALSTMLRDYGHYINTAEIKEKNGEYYILASLKNKIDFFPDLICGVDVEISNDTH